MHTGPPHHREGGQYFPPAAEWGSSWLLHTPTKQWSWARQTYLATGWNTRHNGINLEHHSPFFPFWFPGCFFNVASLDPTLPLKKCVFITHILGENLTNIIHPVLNLKYTRASFIFFKRKKKVPVQIKNLTFGGTASFNFVYCVYLLELYKEEKFHIISHQRIPTQPHKCNRTILTVAKKEMLIKSQFPPNIARSSR